MVHPLMTFILRTLRSFSFLLVSLAAWLATSGTAWAQRGVTPPAAKEYVMQYILIILTVGLVLMLVLRPVGRNKEIKPKLDD